MRVKVKVRPFVGDEDYTAPAFKLDIPGLVITKIAHGGAGVDTTVTHEPTGLAAWWPSWDWYEQPVPVPVVRKCALKAQKAIPIDWLNLDAEKDKDSGRAWQDAARDALHKEEARLWARENQTPIK